VRVTVLAVGRLGAQAEGRLARDYLERAGQAGRRLGLAPVEILEVESRRAGKAAEGEALLAACPQGAHLIACDEGGVAEDSRSFAARIARLRDGGEPRLAFAVGGADGLAPAVLAAANGRLAFGPQTWPHALARVMLCEQIYRAATILAGAPYHRD
jgi:23S rRNA (pseudouridine1915-N3)-methyltransferase